METWIKELIEQMTLEEKIGMIHGKAFFKNDGVERLGIPELVMSDGPCGVRFDYQDDGWVPVNEELAFVSWLPAGTSIAATWNTELAHIVGSILGEEARGRGKDVILAPGINIQRTPLCGRNFEYMSEDPYLTGEMVSEEILGIQEHDVAACVKHFAMNNQEIDRIGVDVIADERTINEIYLPAFKAAIDKGKSYTIMCSYNRLNGPYVSESEYLLNDILKDKWGYDGVVISDWGAAHSTAECALAGLDLEMGVMPDFDNYFFAKPLLEAVNNGEVPEDVIDDKVARLLRLYKRLNMFEGDKRKAGTYNMLSSHEKIHNIARESIVMLKNENVLPLKAENVKKVAVIGDAATRKLAYGGGSSEIKPLFEMTPLQGINMVLGGNSKIYYEKGYYVDNENNVNGDVDWQARSLDSSADRGEVSEAVEKIMNTRKEYRDKALALAKECDTVIYVGGLNRAYDTEGFDRASFDMPYAQAILIEELLKVNPNTVICINSGAAVNMKSFAGDAKAILWNCMNGMTGGLALAEVIFGKVNPSGKLTSTFAYDLADYSSHSIGDYPGEKDENGLRTCRYEEGVYVGYRHFTTNNIKPLFCFGHGLSYSEFEYSDVCVDTAGKKNIKVSLNVKNVSDITGKEVVQLYVTPINPAIDRPDKELKGFVKIELKPSEVKKVTFELNESSFAYYDTTSGSLKADSGKYEIHIGSSSEDIRLIAKIQL